MKRLSVALITLMMSCSAALAQPTADQAKADAAKALATMATLNDPANGISMKYPKSWLIEQPPSGACLARFRPNEPGINMSISMDVLKKTKPLKQFVDEQNDNSIKSMAKANWKGKVVSSKPEGDLSKNSAYKSVIDLSAPSMPAVKITSVSALKGLTGYTLNFTSTAAIHDAYTPVFQEMSKSLKISNGTKKRVMSSPGRTFEAQVAR